MSTPRVVKRLLCIGTVVAIFAQVRAADSQSNGQAAYLGYLGSYKATYVGGNLTPDSFLHVDLKNGDKLKIDIGSNLAPIALVQSDGAKANTTVADLRDQIILSKGKNLVEEVTSSLVTEIDYGQNVPERVAKAIGGAISPGKSGIRYIGLIWKKSPFGTVLEGAVFRVDEKSYAPMLAALERFTGKKSVDTEAREPGT